ncbi:hypothetical protein N577_008970 [Lacticaseibacillus rhamnosus 2166]|nr:hypothetical protein N577_008970 [Lacticaseibacillus rhamnosus 2166]
MHASKIKNVKSFISIFGSKGDAADLLRLVLLFFYYFQL